MALTTREWKLDTCECIVEYSYDDSLPNDQVVYNANKVIHKCPDHQSINTNSGLWNVLTEENPRRNIARKILLNNAPASVYDLRPDGVSRMFKPGVDVDFKWSGTVPDRVLTITLIGVTLTANQKNAAQNFLDNRFPPGKVIFVN